MKSAATAAEPAPATAANRRRIAVVADTHDRVPDGLMSRLRGADEIWHLGDVCRPSVLDPFKALGKPLHVVAGNCDPRHLWPDRLVLDAGEFRFQLQHLPPRRVSGSPAAALHGHLHYPTQEELHGIPILCPGALTGPRAGSAASFAWIELNAAGGWTWRVEPV